MELWQEVGESLATALCAVADRFVQTYPDSWLVLSGEPIAALNVAYIGSGPDPLGRFEAFAEEARRRNLPIKFYLDSEAVAQIGAELLERGHKSTSQVPLMVLSASDSTRNSDAAGFQIELVQDPSRLAEVADMMAEAFQLPSDTMHRMASSFVLDNPDVSYLTASQAGVLCSAMTLIRTGRTVGVWNMATAEAQRRKGAAKALLSYGLARERATGATKFLLLASSMGRPLYEQLGFVTADYASIFRLATLSTT